MQIPKYSRYIKKTEVDNPKSRIIHFSETGRTVFTSQELSKGLRHYITILQRKTCDLGFWTKKTYSVIIICVIL